MYLCDLFIEYCSICDCVIYVIRFRYFVIAKMTKMWEKKVQLIQPLPLKKRNKYPSPPSKFSQTISPENLMAAYQQMFILQSLVDRDIPLLHADIQKKDLLIKEKDLEIKKWKIMYKLKDEQLKKLLTR